jgi:hypothetical protein
MAAGLWLPRRLVQIDGCDHRWFEGRAPACTALLYVDSAMSRLMVVLFVGAESTFAYFEALLANTPLVANTPLQQTTVPHNRTSCAPK